MSSGHNRDRPSCTIIGGPNGSGKSRIYELLRPDGVFVNADVIARTLNPHAPETVSLAAGRQVLHRLEALLQAQQDFAFETTLSSNQAVQLMRRALLRATRSDSSSSCWRAST